MRILKTVLLAVMLLASLSVIFTGVRGFNAADTWLELFRGLFWIIVGAIAVHVATQGITEQRSKL